MIGEKNPGAGTRAIESVYLSKYYFISIILLASTLPLAVRR